LTTTSNQLQFEIVLVKECIEGDRKAQHKLYNLYASKMYALCMRYGGNADDAQDMLQEGFFKVFKNIAKYRGDGSLEGWIRKVFVFSCIEAVRKRNKVVTQDLDNIDIVDKALTGFEKISMYDLMKVVQMLPDGYRAVFNLFMVEGYTHKEISEILGISESTSKSQLMRAKAFLQDQILLLKN
jgi:RNA polymerase sigma factor (sigma-70 family)